MMTLRKIGLGIANFQAKIIIFLIYIFILPFFYLIFRLLGQEMNEEGFVEWSNKNDKLTDVQKQY